MENWSLTTATTTNVHWTLIQGYLVEKIHFNNNINTFSTTRYYHCWLLFLLLLQFVLHSAVPGILLFSVQKNTDCLKNTTRGASQPIWTANRVKSSSLRVLNPLNSTQSIASVLHRSLCCSKLLLVLLEIMGSSSPLFTERRGARC